jgi:hypothetical protein
MFPQTSDIITLLHAVDPGRKEVSLLAEISVNWSWLLFLDAVNFYVLHCVPKVVSDSSPIAGELSAVLLKTVRRLHFVAAFTGGQIKNRRRLAAVTHCHSASPHRS